jgi:metal-responsive CopG/Arc/MetJ family transcriptional regulator
MKITVSIPDDILDRAEKLAERTGRSHSELYSAALREYVARHTPEDVTEAMNRVCDEVDTRLDAFGVAAARRTLQRSEW